MINELRFILSLFKDYGLDVTQIGLIIFLFWKLFANHLKHLAKDITIVKSEVSEIKENQNNIKERVSYIEGQIKIK